MSDLNENNKITQMKSPIIREELVKDSIKEYLEERAFLEERVKEEITFYITTHKAEINSLIQKIIQQGIGNAVLSAINLKFSNELQSLALNLNNRLNND
jgi:hypothetical protein